MPKAKLPAKNFKWYSDLAYVIGLIVTDGNLSKDGRHITMRSSEKDLLKTFSSCLNLKNRISKGDKSGYSKKLCYRIQFGNVQFYNWLVRIGIKPNKTFSIGEIKIPNKFFADFLRGHLDGDGSIWTYKDYYNTYKNSNYVYNRLFIRFISASQDHINWLDQNIYKCFDIKGHIFKAQSSHNNTQKKPMWQLKFAKKSSIKLIHRIYYQEELPCLKRKRKVAQKALKINEEENKKRKMF